MKNYDLSKSISSRKPYFKLLNIHPQNKIVRDCVKRAIALAGDIPYNEVKIKLNRHKKVTGAKKFNEKINDKSFMENELGWVKHSHKAISGESRMNGERFCEAYSKGNFVLQMAGHLTCCIDGIIYDTWDCTDKCVYTSYEVINLNNNNNLNKVGK